MRISYIVAALGLLLLTAGGGSVPPNTPENPAGLSELRGLCTRAGLNSDWTTFLCAVAHHESRWNNNAANRSDSEARAAGAAYDRNAERYIDCPHSRPRYAWGSGGWFGFLPANALRAFWDTELECLDPHKVFEPEASLVMAVDYARRLMRYAGFREEPTWVNLNRGWAAPSRMGEPLPATDERFANALRALGVPVGWGSRNVTALPSASPVELYRRLKGGQS